MVESERFFEGQFLVMPADMPAREDHELLSLCREAVLGVEPVAEVILYGSRARGDASVDSDYDLLVLVEGCATLAREERVRDRLYPLELETGAVLTVNLESRQRWNSSLFRAMPFVQAVEREGITL